jgi:RNA polymerase sigma-70 factor (ECF subfamily)
MSGSLSSVPSERLALSRDEDDPPNAGTSPPSQGEVPSPTSAEVAAVWRLLRRLGAPDSEVDDATQEVFLIVAQRAGEIHPGRLRSFTYGVALRVARETARRARRRPLEFDETRFSVSPEEGIEDSLDRSKARALLDELLERMPYDLRVVLVLFEIEELSTLEIAEALDLPRGTVASRLRRAREDFQARVGRLRAQLSRRG